ncbi:MAG: hypothetical protein PF795_12015 [Kiritimatiellae bacterium]|jgi:hypothetical protein|nr:hypothetical protein [Kiritimatiellia bacterium]
MRHFLQMPVRTPLRGPFRWILLFPLMALAQVPMDDPVAAVLSKKARPPFQERHHLLHALNEDQIRAGANDMFNFLWRNTVPTDMNSNDFHSLKNDVADILISRQLLSTRHLRRSLDTIENPDADEVWRDYCLQKLPTLFQADGLPARDLQRGKRILDSLTQGEVPRLAGTALIAAHRMLEEGGSELAPAPEELARRALSCAEDLEAPLIDRVSALQIAAQLRAPGVFDFAADYLAALDTVSPDMLHVSALAALGYSENPAYLDLLSRHRLSPDIRLRAAARGSIQRLQP